MGRVREHSWKRRPQDLTEGIADQPKNLPSTRHQNPQFLLVLHSYGYAEELDEERDLVCDLIFDTVEVVPMRKIARLRQSLRPGSTLIDPICL